MGIYDRDYYREPVRGGFGGFSAWSITTWLIVVNVVVFVLDIMLNHAIYLWGYFSVNTAIGGLEIWRFLTFQFLHESVGHIFWNMLGLYFFGPIVEAHLGSRRYLGFYLSCGIAGAISFLLLWRMHILVYGPDATLVGASAGILGVVLGAARLAPNLRVMLLFPPIPLSLRVMAWGFVAVAVWTVLTSGPNAGGEAAHLGGALWGFFLIRNENWLNFLTPRRSVSSGRKRMMFRDWSRDRDH